ncbi:Hypothetical protein, putative [Bodo saltans]|uniref:Uncharacterized protein n=1 Tax=Bodo saltans TaxID=75058 RepID=A0A0S4IZV9_BODSA|nr:Hypothetical protein, putative [Bodo saltans]|eukprot:CUG69895.1 Hypothetical protein, putative [Bodo saltans]
MSSNKPSVTLLPKPEEPTVDAFIGEVRERRATGGLSRPVGGGNIRPFGFPQVDRNKNYGMHTLHPSTPSTQDDGAPSVRNTNSDKKQRSVAFVDPNEKSANHQHIPAATTSSAGSSSYAQSNQNSNSSAIILATMHYNSFLGDKTYTLSDALLLAVTGATIHNGDSSSSSSSLSPAAAFCPERVSGEDFVHLLEKALSSAIAHHRLAAMDVICRELMSCEASDGANDTFRHYFLFGPHCGRRVHRLVLCLSQAAPREVVRVLEVLCKLVGELLSSAQQHAETLSDFAVPLGDASVDSAPPLAESEQPTFEPFPSEDQLRQFSEDLRLDLGKGLYLLGLHLVLPRVAIPPSEWGVAAGVAAPEARRVFWSLLAMCASYPPTLVAWFGSNGQESHRGGAFLAMVKREISATMQPFVLGHESYLSPDDNANQNALSFAFQSFGNEVLLSLLQFLRRACHVRQG